MGLPRTPKKSETVSCRKCTRPDSVANIVQCDACDDFFHYDCVDFNEEKIDEPFYCETCQGNISMAKKIEQMKLEKELMLERIKLAKELEQLRIEESQIVDASASPTVQDPEDVVAMVSSAQTIGESAVSSSPLSNLSADSGLVAVTRPAYQPSSGSSVVSLTTSTTAMTSSVLGGFNFNFPTIMTTRPSTSNATLVTSDSSRQIFPRMDHPVANACASGFSFDSSMSSPDEQYLSYEPPATLTQAHITARKSIDKELPKFDGNPEDFPIFVGNYLMSSKACGFSHQENLLRLQKSLTGNARSRVKSLLVHPENTSYIIRRLRDLYGRPELIAEHFIAKFERLPAVKMDKLESIVDFGVTVHNACTTMKSSGSSGELCNSTTLRLLVGKLPPQMKIEWSSYVMSKSGTANLIDFDSWIDEKAMAASRMMNFSELNKGEGKRLNLHDDNEKKVCPACQKSCKSLPECDEFKKMTVQQRRQIAKRSHVCYTCLMKHRGRCKVETKCGTNGCEARHHKLVHLTDSNQVAHQVSHHRITSETLFRILPVRLLQGDKFVMGYAFFDNGSSITLMEQPAARDLQLRGPKTNLCLRWTGDTTRNETDSMTVSVKISGIWEGARTYELKNVRTVQKLSLAAQSLDMKELYKDHPHLRNLPIQNYENAVPIILIGLDNWKVAAPLQMKQGRKSELLASRSKLGWSVYGKVEPSANDPQSFNFHTCDCQMTDDLPTLIREAVGLDGLGVSRDERALLSAQDRRAVEIQEATTRRVGNRYETGLLWSFEDVDLPDSRAMALKRAVCTERTYYKQPLLRTKINELMAEYRQLNYIRKLTKDEEQHRDGRTWYLPLFCTTNPNKPNKVRPVWDGAAKVGKTSLNSVLLKGPDHVPPLPQVLMRFRQRKFSVWGDIKHMFHQVCIREQDQNSQRFLFRENESMPFDTYVMQRMTFGASCSPSSAQFVKNMNARTYSNQYPRAVESILHNHYVDDMLDSVDTADEAIQLAKDVRSIHANAGFEIRNWRSNSMEVERELENGATDEDMLNLDGAKDKVLGMWFDRRADCFIYPLNLARVDREIMRGERIPTKREVLRVRMSIFDPNQHLAPFVVHLSILLQDVWRSGRNWDDELPPELHERWLTWIGKLSEVKNLKIPRCFLKNYENYDGANIQLHVFVDAGAEACAAVTFIRVQKPCCDEVDIAQIGAKVKVAPVKLTSIPRLELTAALIGARYVESVKEWLSVDVHEVWYWSDSMTVLGWIRMDHRALKPYVAFRVSEIREISDVKHWNWISTKDNVADLATKSTNIPVLDINDRWYTGPDFLKLSKDQWPVKDQEKLPEITEELRVMVHQKEPGEYPSYNLLDISHYSNWRVLLRRVAFYQRYARQIKLKLGKNYWRNALAKVHQVSKEILLDSSEYVAAENYLFQMAQLSAYVPEITAIREKKSIERTSTLRKLSPYLDEHGTLRAEGRIDAACVGIYTKRPIILPRGHRVTYLIVQACHEQYSHRNQEVVVCELRKRFYIPKIRSFVRHVVLQCMHCRVNKAKPAVPRMASLPLGRLAAYQPAFAHTGIDFLGPIEIVVRRSTEKRWVALMTCLTTRAVHTEIAGSLDASSCIMAIRNFQNRRGTPKCYYSDNGTNLVAAERIMREEREKLQLKSIAAAFISAETGWKFNPPSAPHFGGVWERKVRSIKNALYATLPKRKVSEEVLRSCLIEAENICNSHPLSYLPLEDPNAEPLTPNHFVRFTGEQGGEVTELDERKDALINNWRIAQLFRQHFWKRWIQEYLPELVGRTKWHDEVENIKIGDIVVIVDRDSPVNTWPKGVVIEIFENADGRVRQAVVRTVHGIYRRPVAKLAVLKIESLTGQSSTGVRNVANSHTPSHGIAVKPIPSGSC